MDGKKSFPVFLLFAAVFLLFETQICLSQSPNGNGIASDDRNSSGSGSNTTRSPSSSSPEACSAALVCVDGIILPAWRPIGSISAADKAFRAVVYFLAMIYMFLGVSIIADRFMASIEVITSQEREVTIQKPSGETVVVQVRVWNETVSNLTLMALGSSAPEILLSIIEIIGNGFNAGDLGPGTIVGSAAFNLFVIIGLCVAVIPNGETRRIKHLRVFIITASWSVFAYLWLYVIIAISSPGVVDVWEGIVTFLFFPATVISAYVADKKIFFGRFLARKYRGAHLFTTVVVAEPRDNIEMGEKGPMENDAQAAEDAELKEFEKTRREYIEILRELRKKHPDVDMRKLEEMAAVEVLNRGPKSRAFYRIQATRKLTGGGKIIKKKTDKMDALDAASAAATGADEAAVTRVYFEPGHYTVMENVGSFAVTVTRQGGNLDATLYVDYRTEDGTANAGADYVYADGTLVFFPGEVHKQFQLSIIDDDIFEEDEHFYVRLSNVRSDSLPQDATGAKVKAQLVNPFMATVMILDDDHAGIFHFEHPETTFPESIGEASVRVIRSSGARGVVHLPYRTVEGSAKGNEDDYEDEEGELVFENDETEAFIKIRIINKEEYEKNVSFEIELGKPYTLHHQTGERIEVRDDIDDEELESMTEEERIATLGRPQLGDVAKVTCNISESIEFKGVVDKLLRKANMSLVVGTSSWREQFVDAVTVRSGDDDDEDDDDDDDPDKESRRPSCSDYVMHSLSFFWKVLFAFVPPTDYLGGWAAFCVSILIIGLLTAIIGDIASAFGCTVGLLDAVTALSFVALGTSIPDTFASKVAAIHDAYADSSIGNVTGSNAVNVFLGIGIAWSIAAVYHAVRGTVFVVNAGSLGFSVTMFCCCAFVCIALMLVRRLPPVHGELGGPPRFKYATSLLLFGLWVFYVLMSSLEAYCYVKGF